LGKSSASRSSSAKLANFIAIGGIAGVACKLGYDLAYPASNRMDMAAVQDGHLAGVAAPAISSYLLNKQCIFA